MRLLIIASTLAAATLTLSIVEADDTFQLNNEDDRNGLLDYLETEADIDRDDAIITVLDLAEGRELAPFVDEFGVTIEPTTYALPPREEIDVDPAEVLNSRLPADDD